MKKLINVAEELYKQIDKAQVHLINARLQKTRKARNRLSPKWKLQCVMPRDC